MAPFQTRTARLVLSVPLSEFTSHLEFAVRDVPRFGFVPGQWLSLKANTPDGEEITRAYSIASAPSENGRGHVAFCLNRVDNGFMSNHLCSLAEGSEITFQGPFGDFILHPPLRDTIFIATSTGIAPFRSMLHWVLAEKSRHQDKHFWLLFGSRYESDIYYHGEFLDLAAKHQNFHYLPTLSRGGLDWQGLRGYVQEHIASIAQGRADMHAYISGLDKMIKSNCDLLQELGWDRKSISFETYD